MRLILTVLLVWGLAQTESTEDPQLKALKTQEQQLARQLLRDFPESEEPLVLLGDFYQHLGKTDQACKFWQRVLKKNDRRADVYDRMAKVASAKDDYETSTRLWRTALQMNPSVPNLHNNLSRSLMQSGQYPEAQQLLEKEIRISSDNTPSYLLLGAVHLELRRYEDAERCYQKMLEPVAPHYFLLGWAYDVTGDRARALKALRRAVALDPQNQTYQEVLQQMTAKETSP